ncbi:MAG TPA: DUF5689 domain-containing protein [Bacteroidales bacterium]|nr:DUF5689 domain-containing protein [Bacteroidales bacterium]HPF03672.1 DUF5689 domain-containing protein [Bacteroidales bacterium]HPJ59140.1 DUF5689 domain-containing protein [Bacteroidales bacterium]HPR12752.1 DUF5689 domain-containing protein [Bacteroidales bacterium]HRW84356.1 DUF5689 domain-containing protein [Bacteroidales bacterium]
MKKTLLSLVFIVLAGFFSNVSAQTIIASWSFDGLLAPTSEVPTASVIQADYGSSTSNSFIYLDGTNGSSSWISVPTSPELTAFSGTTLNDPRPTPASGMALALANNTANGKSLVIKFSTLALSKIKVLLATRGTSTGFDTHSWEWSTDNISYTACATNAANKTSTWSVETVDLTSIEAINNAATVYLKLTVTGATSSSGNNRIDNLFIIEDSQAPIPDFDPENEATDVAIGVIPTVTYNEAIRKTDGNALENSDLASLVTFKKTDASGDNVPFSATIDDSKKVITITPSASLDNSQLYYLAVGAVEDLSGNETTGSNITFTTVSASAATITLTAPAGGETYYAGQNVDITWTSANVDNVKIEAWVVDSDRTYKWETLVETMPAASGLLNFIIPGDALYGTQYQIRISDASNAAVNSVSGDFTLIAVATSLTDLKNRCIINDIVKISSEVTVTFLRSSANRNQKYIQDSGAGLLIDDASAILTTPLAVGDNIQNLEGKLGYYNGMNQIVPTKTTVSVASSGNTPVVTSVTIAEITASFDPYEARLVKLVNVNFPIADGSATFGSEKTYDLTDGVNTIKFFTFEAPESDIVGSIIPMGNYDVTGLAMRYNTTVEIASRTLNDLSVVTGIENALQRDDIKVYPVPASSLLNLSNVPGLRSVEVLDIAGKVIKTINTSSDEVVGIPVSGLTRGTYILKINTTEGTLVRRFVKQ